MEEGERRGRQGRRARRRRAEFAKAIGLDADMSAGGMGVRSKRYAMVVDDGVVKTLNIEDAPGKADISGAENLLKGM